MSDAGSPGDLQEKVAGLEEEIASLRGSRRRLASANDSERRAIERELHDGVQQQLVALAVEVQRLAGLMDDPAAAKALVGEMQTTVRAALDDARRLATRAYPPIADGRGLAAALRSVANEAGVVAVVELPAGADYPPEIAAALYWTWADVVAWISAGTRISVLEVDGGLNFTLTGAGQRTEPDLDRMRDRIEALDGRLNFEDGHDGSKRVQGWLPLPG